MFSILVAASLKSFVVLALAWMASLLLRRSSAAKRHLVWVAAAIALLALPFLSESLPHLSIPAAVVFEPATFTAASAALHDAYYSDASPVPPRGAIWRFDWQRAIVLLWFAGAASGLLRLAIAYLSIRRIRRGAAVLDDRTQITELAHSLGIDRPVEVYLTEPGSMPMTAGPLSPAVFLPEDSRDWSGERRNLVLLHELAHVRRDDPALHLMGRIALTLYWWNPLAWLAWREFLKERERAADDLVLNSGARASDYASHLLDIARSMRTAALAGSAAIGMARKSQLEGRLMAILDAKTDRKNPRIGVWIAAALAVAIVTPIAAVHAQQQRTATQTTVAQTPGSAANLIKLGQGQLIARNFEQAIDYFQQARLADAQQSGLALMWEAIANDRSDRPDQAESLFKSAMAQQDPQSMDYARTEKIYAQFLRSHQRAEETMPLEASADAIQKANGQAMTTVDNVYHIGGEVTQPKLLTKVEPRYSEEARIAKLQGNVQLSVVIQTDGTAQNVIVTRPLGLGLDEQAIEALAQWRFTPAMKNGVPVAAYATIEVNFRLM